MPRPLLVRIVLGLGLIVAVALIALTPAYAAAPSNDDFAAAATITALPFSDQRDVSEASAAPDDPFCSRQAASVWYAFTPTTTADVIAQTLGSSFNTTLSIYTGARGNLTQIACNDDSSFGQYSVVRFRAQANTTYYLMVGAPIAAYPGPGEKTLHLAVEIAPPVAGNDEITTATPIAALPFTDTPDSSQATRAADDPSCMSFGSATLWYRFTPTTAQRISVRGSGFSAESVSIYSGAPGNLTQLACQRPDGLPILVDLAAGQSYLIMVEAEAEPINDVQLSVEVAPPGPANDSFDQATTIATLPFSTPAPIANASPAFDDPSCGRQGATLWYRFTPSADVRVTADMAEGSFGANVAVYSGTRGNLRELDCSTWGEARFDAVAGVTYYIMVNADPRQSALFQLALNTGVANDDAADATVVSALPFSDQLTTRGATTDPEVPRRGVDKNVWYRFTPATTTPIAVSTLGSDYDTYLAIYQEQPDSFVYLWNDDAAGSEQSRIVFEAQAGVTYYVETSATVPGTGGALVFQITRAQLPANDSFDRATPIKALPFRATLDTSDATSGYGDGNCGGNAASVWYSFTPTAATQVTASTAGSGYQTTLSAYKIVQDEPYGYLSQIACAYGNPGAKITFTAEAGQRYYLMIGSLETAGGALSLAVDGQALTPVRPVLECVVKRGNDYTAFFGYQNDNAVARTIAPGDRNRFTPAPADRGQPASFAPGRQRNVFSVPFDGRDLAWTLDGSTVTASKHSPRCP
jgi:hypothetical protein